MRRLRSPKLPDLAADDLTELAEGCAAQGDTENLNAWTLAALHQARSEGALTSNFQQAITNLLERVNLSTNAAKESAEYMSMCVADGDPFKIEVLSEDPRIVVFPDFLNPRECEVFRHISQEKLSRAKVYMGGLPEGGFSLRRTNKVAWMSDDLHPLLGKVSRRIALATGLTLTSSEMYQVANYGLGGHYVPHPDYAGFGEVQGDVYKSSGNRLATMLMYLADVAGGGATAFINMRLAVKPTLGTALFWYNLKPYDGPIVNESFWNQRRFGDPRTFHMGCPVLTGSKWIATKWIHEREQGIVTYNLPN
ncbi:hypothetical protein HPB47_023692 [Ixodes persulcatus]|uniref:Uncharacterized protein n=1 Tax=Ixodes persulcatus TaxID=34615 RepID=A0AC60Q6L7_IXOPE|nr:hypothetical protein HPB47_023692 [Ixodes persulcatus]